MRQSHRAMLLIIPKLRVVRSRPLRIRSEIRTHFLIYGVGISSLDGEDD